MRTNRVVVCLCLLLAACQKHVPLPVAAVPPPAPAPANVPTPAPAPAPILIPVPVPAPAPKPAVSPLNEADRAFNSGNYDESARRYEDYLRVNTDGNLRDQAMFYRGMSYALRPGPAADWTRAAASFK